MRFYLVSIKEGRSAMSGPHSSTDERHEAGLYEIRLRGHLATRWAAWFDAVSLTHESDGTTVIRGSVIDQARAAWLAEQGTRFRSALDRGYAARFQTNERDRTMKITASNLTHWAGLSAIVAGIMYVIVGLIQTALSIHLGLAR